MSRHHADELLVMASDGLWDVMNNQEACTLAKKCLLRARQRGSSRQVRPGVGGRDLRRLWAEQTCLETMLLMRRLT